MSFKINNYYFSFTLVNLCNLWSNRLKHLEKSNWYYALILRWFHLYQLLTPSVPNSILFIFIIHQWSWRLFRRWRRRRSSSFRQINTTIRPDRKTSIQWKTLEFAGQNQMKSFATFRQHCSINSTENKKHTNQIKSNYHF